MDEMSRRTKPLEAGDRVQFRIGRGMGQGTLQDVDNGVGIIKTDSGKTVYRMYDKLSRTAPAEAK